MTTNGKSEQFLIADEQQINTDGIDLDALFPVNPNRDAILAEIAAKVAPDLAAIDEETQATIAAEFAQANGNTPGA